MKTINGSFLFGDNYNVVEISDAFAPGCPVIDRGTIDVMDIDSFGNVAGEIRRHYKDVDDKFVYIRIEAYRSGRKVAEYNDRGHFGKPEKWAFYLYNAQGEKTGVQTYDGLCTRSA